MCGGLSALSIQMIVYCLLHKHHKHHKYPPADSTPSSIVRACVVGNVDNAACKALVKAKLIVLEMIH